MVVGNGRTLPDLHCGARTGGGCTVISCKQSWSSVYLLGTSAQEATAGFRSLLANGDARWNGNTIKPHYANVHVQKSYILNACRNNKQVIQKTTFWRKTKLKRQSAVSRQ